jgi:PTS system nitrogen regulatory IIA component
MNRIAPGIRLDPDVTTELLLDREKLMPTAFNNGVAVPHSRECLQQICFDLVSIVVLEKPIEYGAFDEKPVDLLFFLFASGDKMHLHLLSKLAHLASNDDALAFLRKVPGKSEILDFIRSWESTLRS